MGIDGSNTIEYNVDESYIFYPYTQRDLRNRRFRSVKLNGDKVKVLREKMKLTQEQLGTLAGVTGAYISLVEKGRGYNPLYETVTNLAKALHVKPEEIILKQKAG